MVSKFRNSEKDRIYILLERRSKRNKLKLNDTDLISVKKQAHQITSIEQANNIRPSSAQVLTSGVNFIAKYF